MRRNRWKSEPSLQLDDDSEKLPANEAVHNEKKRSEMFKKERDNQRLINDKLWCRINSMSAELFRERMRVSEQEREIERIRKYREVKEKEEDSHDGATENKSKSRMRQEIREIIREQICAKEESDATTKVNALQNEIIKEIQRNKNHEKELTKMGLHLQELLKFHEIFEQKVNESRDANIEKGKRICMVSGKCHVEQPKSRSLILSNFTLMFILFTILCYCLFVMPEVKVNMPTD